MDRIPRLLAAARGGDVSAMQQLLNEDPQILQRVASSTIYTETPLHVAALAGKTDFARELITLMPSFALEKNPEGLIPLHIASASGHIDIVTELLTLDSCREQCLLKGQGGRIPLHDAIIKGRVSVIEQLISHCAESLKEVTEKGETVFHLASKNNQSEALQLVTERMKQHQNFMNIFNAKDKGGNTFWGTSQTEENIKFEKSQQQNAILVVAALVVTVTYQACLSPPPTIWKENMKPDMSCIFQHLTVPDFSKRVCPASTFYGFMVFNTTAFLKAISLLLQKCLTKKEFTALLVVILPLIFNYVIVLESLCPNNLSSLIIPCLSMSSGPVIVLFIFVMAAVLAKLLKALILRRAASTVFIKNLSNVLQYVIYTDVIYDIYVWVYDI